MGQSQFMAIRAGHQVAGLDRIVATAPAFAPFAQFMLWQCSHWSIAPFVGFRLVGYQCLQGSPTRVDVCLLALAFSQIAVSTALRTKPETIGPAKRFRRRHQPQPLADDLRQVEDVVLVDDERFVVLLSGIGSIATWAMLTLGWNSSSRFKVTCTSQGSRQRRHCPRSTVRSLPVTRIPWLVRSRVILPFRGLIGSRSGSRLLTSSSSS